MKNLKKQDKQGIYNGDVYLMAFDALKAELGWLQKIEDANEYDVYSTPKGEIKISTHEIEGPDFKIKCIEENETTILYCKYLLPF